MSRLFYLHAALVDGSMHSDHVPPQAEILASLAFPDAISEMQGRAEMQEDTAPMGSLHHWGVRVCR